MSSRNVAALIEALAHIERDPNAWNQSSWMDLKLESGKICATAGCLAGWICLTSGVGHPLLNANQMKTVLTPGVEEDAYSWVRPDGVHISIDTYAMQLLGFTADDDDDDDDDSLSDRFDELFSGSADIDDLYSRGADLLEVDETRLRQQVAERVKQLDEKAIKHQLRRHAIPLETKEG